MPEGRPGLLKIYTGADGSGPVEIAPPPGLEALAEELYRAEILRPAPRDAEPCPTLSLPWYLAAEQLRYQKQGYWLPASLEFSRHAGEKVLGLGGGLGSDWVGYALNGCEVVAVCPSSEQRDIIQRNFDLRRLPARCEQAPYYALPLPSATIDVVCVAAPHTIEDLPRTLDEVYRVLKPGGKVILIVPAGRSIQALYPWLPGGRADTIPPASLLAGGLYSTAELWKLAGRFNEAKISRRYLRRSEVPTLLRLAPLFLLERLSGRLLIFKGFKPLSAAKVDQVAA